MAQDLIRDSAFGQLVRLVLPGRFFLYAEEKDASLLDRYINKEKTHDLRQRGTTNPSEHTHSEEEEETSSTDDRRQEKEAQKEEEEAAEAQKEEEEAAAEAAAAAAAHQPDAITAGEDHPNITNAQAEKGQDRTVIDWYGPDDPENPRNWSRGKRFFVTFEIIFLTFSIYIGSAIYTGSILGVSEQFGVSPVVATLGLTLYVAGYGLGPMIFAPMSEIPYFGRNPIYLATLFIFVLLQIPTALASNIGMLLAFRFLTGLFGSPVLATGGATIVDMYRPQKQSYGLAVWGIGAVSGPCLGPVVANFAIEAKGWTWPIWELMWLSGVCLVFLFFLLPETSSTNILLRRTRRARKITGNQNLVCEPELMAEDMTGREIVLMTLIRPITLNFTEPVVFFLNLYIALLYGLLYIWFESFPLVFIGIYDFSLGTQGLAFLGILVGAFFAMIGIFSFQFFYQEKQFDDDDQVVPEKRLIPAMVGAFLVPICLFWFGWSARKDIHWIMPIIGSSFFGSASYLLFQAVLPYLADAYPDYTASVFAGNDLFRSSFGAGFPLFATGMYHQLGIAWASSLLAFLGVAFIPIPFVLYRYGAQLRRMSKYARKNL